MNKSDIEELILEKKKSTLGTHFNDTFFYNTLKYSGEIRKNEILLWTSSYWLRGGYPIFRLKFDSENQLNRISTELNPFGKLIDKLTIIAICTFTMLPIIGYGFNDGWKLGALVIFIAIVLFLILKKASKSEKKIMTEELREVIENLEREKYPEKFQDRPKPKKSKEKEWTLKKVIIRLIFYPISIIIIYFCLTEILPNGKAIHGLFGIGVCGLYLIVDILNIMKK